MKIIETIIFALAVFSFCSCTKDSVEPDRFQPEETLGVMEVVVTEQTGMTEDKMETVRFIVFKNASTLPVMELNECFEIPVVSGDKEVSRFKIALEVSRKENGNNDKLVVAVINEPIAMKGILDAVKNYDQLRNIELDFAYFLTSDHLGLQDNKLMPMTGVILTDKIYATAQEALDDPVSMTVQRTVARVDVYLCKEAGLDIDLGSGTQITLQNTYDKEYLVGYGNNFALNIQTITSGFLTKTWMLTATDSKELPSGGSGNGRLVCSFYTPERTCIAANDADKLLLKIHVVSSEGANREGEVIIDKFRKEGIQTDIDEIIRNNIYKVITTVKSNSITAEVLDWNEERIETEF